MTVIGGKGELVNILALFKSEQRAESPLLSVWPHRGARKYRDCHSDPAVQDLLHNLAQTKVLLEPTHLGVTNQVCWVNVPKTPSVPFQYPVVKFCFLFHFLCFIQQKTVLEE